MNAAAAGLRSNRATASAGKTNATSPGFYIHGPGYAAYFDIAATG